MHYYIIVHLVCITILFISPAPDPPRPAPPVSVAVSNIGPTGCTIVWAAPPAQIHNSITNYTLILTDMKYGLPTVRITISSSQLSYIFTNLEEYGIYVCEIVAVSEYGLNSTVRSVNINTLVAGEFDFTI